MSFPSVDQIHPSAFILNSKNSPFSLRKNKQEKCQIRNTSRNNHSYPILPTSVESEMKHLSLVTNKANSVRSKSNKDELVLMIKPSELVGKMKNESKSLLLVDTRSSKAYSQCHINNSINPFLRNCMIKKKIEKKAYKLKNLVSCPKLREQCDSDTNLIVILYDDNSKRTLIGETIYQLYNCLIKDGKAVHILDGGLHQFKLQYRDLCVELISELPIVSPTSPHEEQNVDIESVAMAKILDFLYIGNEWDSANKQLLKANGITHILNVTAHLLQHFENEGIIYHRLLANDSGDQNLRQYFDEAFNFIESARKSNGKVLVHCMAGVSRSATIVISYILRMCTLNTYQIYKFVKSKREIVAPNLNFMGQLNKYENELNASLNKRRNIIDIDIVD